jgi:two-component system cell cycle sensor histidine kinase/response regulator CckA
VSERAAPNTTSRQNGQTGPAVLLLGASGRITTANASARALWQAGDAELIGEHFAGLFVFEITSQDPDFLDAQWEVLVSAASSKPITLQALAREGAPREVEVRLEPTTGGAPDFIAVVTPVEKPAPVTPPEGAPPDHGTALLSEHGTVGFFDLNFLEKRIHYSPAWKKLLGYVDAELPNTYETWLQALHPDDTAAAPDKLRKKRSPGPGAFSVEFRMRHRRGHYVWIQCLGVQVVGADGTLERVTGLHLDITERKELEESSLANDDRLQALTDDDAPLAAFELDFATQNFWYSPAWRRLLGFGDGDTTAGEAAFAAVLPGSAAEAGVGAFFLAPATGQTNFSEVVQLRHRDGRVLPFLLGVHRQLNRKRELLRVVGFVCPLTAAVAAPAELGGPLLAELLGTLAEGFIATDERGKVLAVNATAARLLGLSAEQATGQLIGDVFRLVNRQSGRPGDDAVDRVLSADGPLPLIAEDALLPAGSGPAGQGEPTALPIVWTARVARDTAGKPLGVVVVFRDPEEMRLTPEELVRSNRFESLGLLAGGIAHDFNNLLTTILGGISLAKDNRDYGKLPDAEKACLTAKGLTKQLLAFAKGSGGTQVVVNPRDILEDAVKIAAAASTAAVTVDTSDDLKPVQVDRGQILQVFQNLVINALQAMPPAPHQAQVQLRAGNVTLTDGQVPPLPAGDYVQFEARDNGSGIKPEYLEKIWDPFFTTKKHGTGLGLATVLSIVRQHGGMIGVDSTLGVGTVFTVFLPVADRPAEVQARKPATLRFGTGRVLLMDDDAAITDLTSTMLQSLDYKFDAARNGEEAIVLYKRYLNIGRPYDAVIMDLTVIGGMGGEECFQELKKLDPEVRAIVSSGYDNDDMAKRFLDLGFCGYLTKPYRVTDLGKVLKAVLG